MSMFCSNLHKMYTEFLLKLQLSNKKSNPIEIISQGVTSKGGSVTELVWKGA